MTLYQFVYHTNNKVIVNERFNNHIQIIVVETLELNKLGPKVIQRLWVRVGL